MNKVILFGNLTRDPELKSLPSGQNVATFGLATNRRVKKDEQWQEVPEFHNIVVWGRQAETSAQYLKKGSQALIEGRLQTRSWEKDGQKRYATEVVAESVTFGRGSGGATVGGASRAGNPDRHNEAEGKAPKDDAIDYPTEDINPDDIPF
jgi:single-strand DNA-binding protein